MIFSLTVAIFSSNTRGKTCHRNNQFKACIDGQSGNKFVSVARSKYSNLSKLGIAKFVSVTTNENKLLPVMQSNFHTIAISDTLSTVAKNRHIHHSFFLFIYLAFSFCPLNLAQLIYITIYLCTVSCLQSERVANSECCL